MGGTNLNVVKEMSKEIFKHNLICTVNEIQLSKGLDFEKYKFIIHPVEEKNKALNSADDFMRLGVLTEKNLGNKKLTTNDVINVLGGLMPLVPIWIDIIFVEIDDNDVALFHLDCSMRFRKPSLLRNSETGHAPFRAKE